ncbi:hypothetical protein MHYP_G00324950 [Metynnis hypsauchen]
MRCALAQHESPALLRRGFSLQIYSGKRSTAGKQHANETSPLGGAKAPLGRPGESAGERVRARGGAARAPCCPSAAQRVRAESPSSGRVASAPQAQAGRATAREKQETGNEGSTRENGTLSVRASVFDFRSVQNAN